MNRFLRAAELAAAAIVLCTTATFAAPSLAEEIRSAPVANAVQGAEQASPSGSDVAVSDGAAAGEPGLLRQLFRGAVAAIVGETPHPAQAPAAPRSLDALVAAYEAADAPPAAAAAQVPDREQDCLANAVYFESRGEPIEGQLAVAQVVLNRAASGRYPADVCSVVTQPAQFSFIRHGRFPQADKGSAAWRKAVAIARIARANLAKALPADVLWYHATYVSPSWGRRLTREAQIGLHIFYS